ncbi:hypothetical protein ES705_46053 [subsurface metagenome]
MESEEIKITGVMKLHPVEKTNNLFEIKNSFNAEEILIIAKRLRTLQAKQMTNLRVASFANDYYYLTGRRFAAKNILLSSASILSLLTSQEGNDSLKTFLVNKKLDSLQSIYGDFLRNSDNKVVNYYDTKEKLVNLLTADPEKLIIPNLSSIVSVFLQDYLISFEKLRTQNIYIDISLTLGIKEAIVFNFMELKGLAPQAKPRFFKLTYNGTQNLPGMREPAKTFKDFQDFFKEAKSVTAEENCILDTEDFDVLKMLKKFISSHGNEEFLLEPIGYGIKNDDMEKKPDSVDEVKKFKVRWPNNLEELGDLFGQRAKSKFLTLTNGLKLLERLEPSQKFIELMQEKKILVDLSTNRGYYRTLVGTPLEAKALEVLILHLKLESVQGVDLMICKVQEKITEETVAYIWQKVEDKRDRHYSAVFSGYQLTE